MLSHPLFKWLNEDTYGGGIGRASHFANSLGFELTPCTSSTQYDGIGGKDPEGVLLAWAKTSRARFESPAVARDWNLAGGWFTGSGNAVVIFVRPKTALAKALWFAGLAELDRAKDGLPRLSEMHLGGTATRAVARGVGQRLGYLPVGMLHTDWDDLHAALDVVLDGFQVARIDPPAPGGA